MASKKISELDTTNRLALREAVLGQHRGALVGLTANITAANYSIATDIPFDAESYDTDGFHDNAINNVRLTVPAGISGWARIGGCVALGAVTSGSAVMATINGRDVGGASKPTRGLPFAQGPASSYTESGLVLVSAPIEIAAGDYFWLPLVCTDTSITIFATRTCFWIEILG